MRKINITMLREFLLSASARQMMRYGIIGFVNVATEYTIFNIFYYALDRTALVANTWALAVTMVSGFIFHHAFTFKNRFYSWVQISRFAGVVAIGSLLNYLILMLLMLVIPQVYIAKLIQIVLLSVYNFNMYKHVVFSNNK